MLNVV
jgi:hypothetical protein